MIIAGEIEEPSQPGARRTSPMPAQALEAPPSRPLRR